MLAQKAHTSSAQQTFFRVESYQQVNFVFKAA